MHMHFDGVAVDFLRPPVEAFFELCAREDCARPLEEGGEDCILTSRQADLLGTACNPMGGGVEGQAQVFDHRLRAATAPSAERARTCSEFFELERLHEVIVSARIEAKHAVGDLASCGENQHGKLFAYAPQFPQHVEPVTARQAEIKDQ